MSDPLSYLPYALAAAAGRVDGVGATSLVAAGFRLLQGSAPLVRALAGRRAAIALPPGPAFVTALAACDGRGALVLGHEPPVAGVERLEGARVGAVLTTAALAPRFPEGLPRVLLDEAPILARVVLADREVPVSLVAHEGLSLEGDPEVEGAEEEAILLSAHEAPADAVPYTHRFLLQRAKRVSNELGLTPADRVLALGDLSDPFSLMMSWIAPLCSGAEVCTAAGADPAEVLARLDAGGVTIVAGAPAMLEGILACLASRGRGLATPGLRAALCGGGAAPPDLPARWAAATGTPLRSGRA